MFVNNGILPAYGKMNYMRIKNGFTIVELIIVIVVIGILAGIAGVSYVGTSQRAKESTLKTDLSNAVKQMHITLSQTGRGQAFPENLPSEVKPSNGNVLQLTHTGDPKRFCINAYDSQGNLRFSIDSRSEDIRPYLCSGHAIGSPVGGSVPTAPKNTNLAGDISTWSTSSGVTYDSGSKELRLSETTAGAAQSALVRIDGAATARFSVESFATKPSPTGTPNTQVYLGSAYFDAAGNPVNNTSGYKTNGNAQALPLNQWKSFTWVTPTGPNVVYVQFNINSHPTGRTSDNRFRNATIEAL